MGHHEIASDSELENADAIAAHRALGYEEVERVVCFRRSLDNANTTLQPSSRATIIPNPCRAARAVCR
jgi:hypothetical protein